jgi:hypothetical protein
MTPISRHFVRAVGCAALFAAPVAAAQSALAQVVLAETGPAASPAAKLQPCETVKDPAHLAALAAAQTWHATHWAPLPASKPARQPARRGWITAYLIPPPPPAPLGIASFARGQDLGAGRDTPTAPIAGFAHVAKLLCATGAHGTDGTIAVQFLGQGLHFQEGGGTWSKPMRRPVLLHALVLSRPAPDAAWSIAEEPEARTALIPGSRLSPPAAAEISAALAPSPARMASAKLRR